MWGSKVSCEFRKKVVEVAKELGLPQENYEGANWLMNVMALETIYTFDPTIGTYKSKYLKNEKSDEADNTYVGLVQFGKDSATDIGTTRSYLINLSAESQLDYVKKFLKLPRFKAGFKTMIDLYLAINYPTAYGQGLNDNYVVYAYPKKAYDSNKLFKREPHEFKIENKKKVYISGADLVKTGKDASSYVWEFKEALIEISKMGEKYRRFKIECSFANDVESGVSVISIIRKWEYQASTNSTSSTVSTFTIDDDNLTGYILEPMGESTTKSGMDKRIPTGTYSLVWHTSVKFPKDKYSAKNKGAYLDNGFPKIYNEDVPQNRGILIHIGNTGKDSEGCLLPGSNIATTTVKNKKCVNKVTNSTTVFYQLIDYIEKKGIENIKIVITESYEDY